jgi:hypothetical protein
VTVRESEVSAVRDDFPDARAAGRICASAEQTQRLIAPWLRRHAWIERGYVTPVVAAYAFSRPWQPPAQLAVSVQFELWVFGADKRIDTDATTRAEVADLVSRWSAVAAGEPPDPDEPHGVALAELLARITDSPLWPGLRTRWEQLFRRTFDGMLTEWTDAEELMSGGPAPTLERYLANSDSCGFRLIRLTDWLVEGDRAALTHIGELMAAAWHGQLSSRLTNDLRTHERERDTIDLNVIKLGCSTDRVVGIIDRAAVDMAEILSPLLEAAARPAIALDRILSFGNGFYETTDFRPAITNDCEDAS